MRPPAVAGVLAVALALGGCAAGGTADGAQEIEPALVDGVRSVVLLPGGELEVRTTAVLDEPPQGAEGDGSFVALAWTPRTQGDQTRLLAAVRASELVAVVDGERVELPLEPGSGDTVPASSGVALAVPDDYDVADLRVEVTLDDVTQVLAPWSGEVDPAQAAPLYDAAVPGWQPEPCARLDVAPPATLGPDGGLVCSVGAVTTAPWHEELGWAEPEQRWWTVLLTTHMVASDVGPVDGAGTQDGTLPWDVGDVRSSEVVLDGASPLAVTPYYQDAEDAVANESMTGAWYVFAGPAAPPEAAEGATLTLRQTYAVEGRAGGPAAPAQLEVDAAIPVGPAVPTRPALPSGTPS